MAKDNKKKITIIEQHILANRLRTDAILFINKSSEIKKEGFSKDIRKIVNDEHCSRIFIGVGVEYLLKCLYVRNGFNVYKAKLKEPISLNIDQLNPSDVIETTENTFSLSKLSKHLESVVPEINQSNIGEIKESLEIVRFWRNHSVHFGGGVTVNSSHLIQVSDTIETLMGFASETKYLRDIFVRIKLDCRGSNGLIRIFEIVLEDCELHSEHEFNNYDEGIYFGYKDDIEVEEIKKYVKERLKGQGYLFADKFEYEVDVEDILIV